MASNFEFYSPTRVIFGKGTEQRVGALVREYGGAPAPLVHPCPHRLRRQERRPLRCAGPGRKFSG